MIPLKETTSTPFREWIQGASFANPSQSAETKYLESAVCVAFELTNFLCLASGIDGANGSSLLSSASLQLNLKDVVSNNVRVHCVDDGANNNNNIQSVSILPSVCLPSVSAGRYDALYGDDDNPELQLSHNNISSSSDGEVCVALGTVLFEIFSKGHSLLMMEANADNVASGEVTRGDDDLLFRDLFLSDADEAASADGGDDDDDNDDGDDATLFNNLLLIHEGSGNRTTTRTATSQANSKKRRTAQSKNDKVGAYLQQQCGSPLSVRRLVSDLLKSRDDGGIEEEFRADAANIASLEDAREDLRRMRAHPSRFLHDRTSPSDAREDTGLFPRVESYPRQEQQSEQGRGVLHENNGNDNGDPADDARLYGRDRELNALTDAARRTRDATADETTTADPAFRCEAAFLSGHSGSGKSSIIKRVQDGVGEGWVVLHCKFDIQTASCVALARSFNDFFKRLATAPWQDDVHDNTTGNGDRPRQQPRQTAFEQVSHSIASQLDAGVFGQLCELMPMFARLFPHSSAYERSSSTGSDAGNVGSGRNRLRHLFHILLNSIFCIGHPVLIVLDDLQWSDSLAMDVIADVIIQSKACVSTTLGLDGHDSSRGGLFLLGSYRDNEADETLLQQIQAMDQISGDYVRVTHLSINMLSRRDVNEMISFMLGLPMRHTKELSEQVFQKTRGHPLFIQSFLRSIISKDVLSFSIRSRRWTWDDLVVEMHTISEDVADFLANRIRRLDKDIVFALQVCACIGFQVSTSTIDLLNVGQFVNDMFEAVESARKEGLMDKAGPIYAFSHDMLRESTYDLIPVLERKSLHKTIGLSLALDPDLVKDAEICTLAVDQINVCKDILNPPERSMFARLNLAAGKHAMASSSYQQARGYFESGITLLHIDPWKKQYPLCLELYELSVVVGFMNGSGEEVTGRLDDILSNAKHFGETIKAREIILKVIASRGEYAESTNQCISILSVLGEDFPEDIKPSLVANELKGTLALLEKVTEEDIRRLPLMTDTSKLYAMKFLSMLCTFSMSSRYHLCHLSSCLLVKFTLQYGFCEESIHGLATFARALLLDVEDVENSGRISSVTESLLVDHANQHSLRARSTLLFAAVKFFTEPLQSVVERCRNGFNSGMISGDVENAMMCGYLCCYVKLHGGGDDLKVTQDVSCDFLRQMAKHKHAGSAYGTMSVFDTCAALSGNFGNSLRIKTNEEIYEEAVRTKNLFLLHHVCVNQIYIHFYLREYIPLVEFAEAHNLLEVKRAMDIISFFFTGISSLSLARDTHQKKWRKIGERSVEMMARWAPHSKWNFENKLFLLQAELHYLDGDLESAEVAYNASIDSAHEHRFIHEEALAYELHGIFLLENKSIDRGLKQLNMSISKYTKWGAGIKVKNLISFMKTYGGAT